jgi:hypothetical protein
MITVGKNKRKVACINKETKPIAIIPPKMEHLTLLLGGSAKGRSLRPLLILPLKTDPGLPAEVTEEMDITGNESGWMTKQIFIYWLYTYFIPELNWLRELHKKIDAPALLLLDNHSSRIDLPIEDLLYQHNIHIIFIPAHSSHLLQPMDKSVNSVFKSTLAKKYTVDPNDNVPDRREKLLLAVTEALPWAMNKDNIKIGWRKAGLVPFDSTTHDNSPMVTHEALPPNSDENRRKRKRGPAFTHHLIANNWPQVETLEI